MNISGSNIIVTGGASGIGLAFATHLAVRGAHVWALDKDRAALEAARAAAADPVQFVSCDVAVEAEAESAIAAIEQESGGIHVLINNAAILLDQALVSKLGGRMRKHSFADWEETLRCNLTSAFLMTREVAHAMIHAKRSGLVVNVSSISRQGNPGQTAYAATKAGIDALTVTWSQELAVYGIRVVAIAPGFVKTPMTRRIPPLFLDRIKEQTPLKRFGSLEEFGHAIEFVVENDYLNGKVLELDGGLRF